MPEIDDEYAKAEEIFVNQAAHLFLALAGLKTLPKPKTDSVLSDFPELEHS